MKEIRIGPVITFVFPHYSNGNLDYHLGANYIIAYLRSKGIYAEQFVIKKYIGLSELVELILARNPMIIGFTCFDANYRLIKLLSQQIKIKRPDILIIAGGPTPTFSDKDLLKDCPEIDICIRHEGEYTTHELIEHLESNQDISNIQGITYRKKQNIIRNPDKPFIKNRQNKYAELDIIPSPYLAGILRPEDLLNQNGRITITTSRGCVHKCAYCNFSAMSKHSIRYYSIDRVIAELKIIAQLRKTGKEFQVVVMDDTFAFNKKRIRQLCQRIIQEKIRLNLVIQTRGNQIDKRLLRLFFDAGIIEINFGLESAVPRILYAMKKVRRAYSKKNGFIPEKRYIQGIKDSVKAAKEIGIRKVTVSTIFGFPGEKFRDGLKTLNFVKGLKVNNYLHNFLFVFSGTELFRSILNNPAPISRHSIKKRKRDILSNFRYSEYALEKLPILDNERGRKMKECLRSFFLARILTGTDNKVKSVYPKNIVFTGSQPSLEWFKKALALQTKIAFGKNIHNLICHRQGNIIITVRRFAEMISFKWPDSMILNKENTDLGYKSCSFLKLARFNKLPNQTPKNATLIFGIYDRKDLQELKKQANLVRGNDIFKSNPKSSLDYIILDGCRWSSNCPASGMERLIIDEKGDIRPCFQAEVIGNTDTPLGKTEKALAALIKKVESQRGCSLCPARDRCSKCIFLGSIAPDEYCNIMRTQPNITGFINSLNTLGSAKFMINEFNKIS